MYEEIEIIQSFMNVRERLIEVVILIHVAGPQQDGVRSRVVRTRQRRV